MSFSVSVMSAWGVQIGCTAHTTTRPFSALIIVEACFRQRSARTRHADTSKVYEGQVKWPCLERYVVPEDLSHGKRGYARHGRVLISMILVGREDVREDVPL